MYSYKAEQKSRGLIGVLLVSAVVLALVLAVLVYSQSQEIDSLKKRQTFLILENDELRNSLRGKQHALTVSQRINHDICEKCSENPKLLEGGK